MVPRSLHKIVGAKMGEVGGNIISGNKRGGGRLEDLMVDAMRLKKASPGGHDDRRQERFTTRT